MPIATSPIVSTQMPAPIVAQAPAPTLTTQTNGTTGMMDMINAIMPLMLVMMMMGMIMPMMKGITK